MALAAINDFLEIKCLYMYVCCWSWWLSDSEMPESRIKGDRWREEALLVETHIYTEVIDLAFERVEARAARFL